ncbi:MAG TPA: 7-cyano-7-deazaguanine synthase QueC [Planctomycetes bacterium]|nr:7-cyano-7-deazaguanine synthase QueC [Fuerstiella sp.]HIK95836.1 7-cyano-7-deazaguanine synthase QueC [Planctomycetota bacterium]
MSPTANGKKAVVLVSGGLDSATVLAIARHEGWEVHAISFDYGQRHRFELESARKVCAANDVTSRVMFPIDTAIFQGSALTNDIAVPHNRSDDQMSTGIPVTYVPARNTIFLSLALGLAESIGSHDLFIGVNAVDYSGYPDCRPEFVAAFETMANLATKTGVDGQRITVHTPLVSMTKAQIIQRGLGLGVDYGLTHSCYDPSPDGISCGECDSCQLRLRGFAEADAIDPILYAD